MLKRRNFFFPIYLLNIFADNKGWLSFGMGLHAASGNNPEVQELFLEWSSRDPRYADESVEAVNRARWESFSIDKPGGIGVGTLMKLCRDHGVSDDVFAKVFNNAADDFDDDLEENISFEPDPIPPIKYDITKLPNMLDYAESALIHAGVPLYQMGGRLIHPFALTQTPATPTTCGAGPDR